MACNGTERRSTFQLRTAPQSSDQSFEHSFNKALKVRLSHLFFITLLHPQQISSETRKPVRVIRGFKLPSPYAPFEGYVLVSFHNDAFLKLRSRYRYDGLYTVEEVSFDVSLYKYSPYLSTSGMDGAGSQRWRLPSVQVRFSGKQGKFFIPSALDLL